MITEEILHEDNEGKKVILHRQYDDSGKTSAPWVTYERYPDMIYSYLSSEEAAEEILKGYSIEKSYIKELSIMKMIEVERDLRTGSLRVAEDIEHEHSEFCYAFFLDHRICISECIIGEIDLSNLVFSIQLDSNMEMPNEKPTHIFGNSAFHMSTFSNYVNFNDVIFHKDAYFKHATFKNSLSCNRVNFNSTANFNSTTFNENVYFETAKFFSGAQFIQATFLKEINFKTTIFYDYATFRGATFNGNACFEEAIFHHNALFYGAVFKNNAIFRSVRFYRGAEFAVTRFLMVANFEHAFSYDGVNFIGATFYDDVFLGWSYLLRVNFSLSRFEKRLYMKDIAAGSIDFTETIVADNIYLSCTDEMDKLDEKHNLTKMAIAKRQDEIEGDIQVKINLEAFLTAWMKSNRVIYTVNFDDTSIQGGFHCSFQVFSPKIEKSIAPILETHKEKDWEKANKQYTWLKEQYRRQGAYEDEDQAHWWAMECLREKKLGQKNLKYLLIPFVSTVMVAILVLIFDKAGELVNIGSRLIDCLGLICLTSFVSVLLAFPYWQDSLIYRKVLGYGVRPWNVIRSIAIVMLFFWLIYIIAFFEGSILPSNQSFAFNSPILDSLYFSVITYATVGYGDIHAIGWAASFAMIEGLLGVILNAAFVVVLFRKLIR
jgi:hypothetical protein